MSEASAGAEVTGTQLGNGVLLPALLPDFWREDASVPLAPDAGTVPLYDSHAALQNEMLIFVSLEPTMPTVDVATIGKVASALVFLLSAFSFVLWLLSGLFLIAPLFSLLLCALSAMFFGLSFVVEREWRGR